MQTCQANVKWIEKCAPAQEIIITNQETWEGPNGHLQSVVVYNSSNVTSLKYIYTTIIAISFARIFDKYRCAMGLKPATPDVREPN